MDRREFLKTTTLATIAIAGSQINPPSVISSHASEKPAVKSYRELGKTGLKMSDISMGTGKLSAASMILRAVDSGINYFDTAPDYGLAEELMGHAMGRLDRSRIIIATKFCNPLAYPSHLPAGSNKKDYIMAVEESLSRMKTDYIDICFVHAIGEMSKDIEAEKRRILDENMLLAFNELKKAGKVRFLGISSHGPNNMEELLMTAVRSGYYDIIMPSFNFMKFPKLPDVIKEAHSNKIAVVAMKTLAGAKDINIDSKGEEFAHAAFKWVLKHNEVSGLVVTIKTVADLEMYLKASGIKFSNKDQQMLDQYAMRYGREYCRTGCNDCERFCPQGVEIANIMRYRMYFNDYGMEKTAMEAYASLDKNAESCASCRKFTCTTGCPYGLPVHSMLADAHKTISFKA